MEEAEGGSRPLVGFSLREPEFVDQSPASPWICFCHISDIDDHRSAGDCASAGFRRTTKDRTLAPSFEIREITLRSPLLFATSRKAQRSFCSRPVLRWRQRAAA